MRTIEVLGNRERVCHWEWVDAPDRAGARVLRLYTLDHVITVWCSDGRERDLPDRIAAFDRKVEVGITRRPSLDARPVCVFWPSHHGALSPLSGAELCAVAPGLSWMTSRDLTPAEREKWGAKSQQKAHGGGRLPPRFWSTETDEHRQLLKVERNGYGDILLTLDRGETWRFAPRNPSVATPPPERFHVAGRMRNAKTREFSPIACIVLKDPTENIEGSLTIDKDTPTPSLASPTVPNGTVLQSADGYEHVEGMCFYTPPAVLEFVPPDVSASPKRSGERTIMLGGGDLDCLLGCNPARRFRVFTVFESTTPYDRAAWTKEQDWATGEDLVVLRWQCVLFDQRDAYRLHLTLRFKSPDEAAAVCGQVPTQIECETVSDEHTIDEKVKVRFPCGYVEAEDSMTGRVVLEALALADRAKIGVVKTRDGRPKPPESDRDPREVAKAIAELPDRLREVVMEARGTKPDAARAEPVPKKRERKVFNSTEQRKFAALWKADRIEQGRPPYARNFLAEHAGELSAIRVVSKGDVKRIRDVARKNGLLPPWYAKRKRAKSDGKRCQ